MKRGIISKRQLIMYLNLMMKKGKILGKKTLGRLMLHEHYKGAVRDHGLSEYEFSCSNSPNPDFSHMGSKHKHHHFPSISYFPCIINHHDQEQEQLPDVLPKASEGVPVPAISQISVHTSNPTDTGMEEAESAGPWQVDADAEKFIKLFYEQLRVQGYTLLQHQEEEYQERLARGA